MPFAVSNCTVTGPVAAEDRLTVKVVYPGAAALPSAVEASLIESDGRATVSSLTTVPTAPASLIVAPVGEER